MAFFHLVESFFFFSLFSGCRFVNKREKKTKTNDKYTRLFIYEDWEGALVAKVPVAEEIRNRYLKKLEIITVVRVIRERERETSYELTFV